MSTKESTTPAAAKVLTVADDMDSRRVFANPTEAAAYLTLSGEKFSDFATTPLAAPGIDEEGNFDPAIYTDQTQVMVSTLRRVGKGTTPGGVKAIVVAPVPTLEALLSDDAGKAWVERILLKELNHVAVRPLRDADNVLTMVDEMPTTRDAYISSARGEGGGIMETFAELYKQINATLASKVPVWAKARLIKTDLKKCLESAGYAREYFPALENRGEGKDSLFVVALQLGIAAAKAKGLDPTIFERWVETRNAKAYDPSKDETDEDDLDIGSLTDSLMTDDKPATDDAPAPAPDAATDSEPVEEVEEAPAS